MKILFDLSPLCRQKTGIPVFVHRLYEAVSVHVKGHKIIPTCRCCRFFPVRLGKLYRGVEQYWYRRIYLPFKLYFGKYDVYVECDYMFRPLFRPSHTFVVLFVYDIALIMFDGLHRETYVKRWEKRLLESIRHCDMIMTVSETSKRDIEIWLYKQGIRKPVATVYADAEPLEVCPEGEHAILPEGFEDYLLVLGTLEPRKNPMQLIRAYHAYSQAHPDGAKLVFAGKKGWLYEELFDYVHQHGLEDRVCFCGYVDEKQKSCLLRDAAALVMLSHYEGFGIPALEAYKAGVPLLLSDIAVFRELFEEGAVYVDAKSVSSIVEGIRNVLDRPVPYRDEVARKFSWEDSAKYFIEILEDAVCVY